MTKEKEKLKIVSVYDSLNGSKLHRLKLPLTALHGKSVKLGGEDGVIEVEILEGDVNLESYLEKADILYVHWGLNIPAFKLGMLLNKYNLKYIVDLDDCPILPKNSIVYDQHKYNELIRQITLADSVVVANPRISLYVEKFVSNRNGDDFKPIHYSPNYLPNEGQWAYKPQQKAVGKIGFGLFGSRSHVNDYKYLRGAIKILGNNKEFVEKAKFVVAGVHKTDPLFREISKVFSEIKAEVEYLGTYTPDEYMNALDKMNVVFAPLEDNEFNYCKSSLKIEECSKRNIPLIGSKAYGNKELSCGLVIEPEDWQNWAKTLISDDNYLSVGAKLGEENRKVSNFDLRIEGLLKCVEYCANTMSNKVDNLQIYSITYKEGQFTEFDNYDNSGVKTVEQKSYLFEWNPIVDIIDNYELKSKYLGIFSYKFPFKTHLSKKLLDKVFEDVTQTHDYDVIGLSPSFFKKKYLKFTEEQHPGFMELFTLVCNDLNLVVKEPKNVVYSNFFIAKTEIYKEFVNTIAKPAIELLETKYKELAWKNANYVSGLQGEELKQQTGLDFYTFHTFVLERLLSAWLENRIDLKFKQIG